MRLEDKDMVNFKNFFKNRTISFWVAFGTSILSIVTAIVYAGAIMGGKEISQYVDFVPFVLILIGGLIFVPAIFLRMSRIGAMLMGIFDIFAMVIFLGDFIAYPASTAVANDGTSILSLPGFAAAIAVVVMMLICVVASNICAWRKLDYTVEH